MKSMLESWLLLGLLLSVAAAEPPATGLPAGWREAWERPRASDRPLQIVHGIDLTGKLPEGMDQLLPDAKPGGIARKGLEYFQQRGLGGLVCNVAFDDYLRSEANWKKLVTAVEACHDLGMIVWIYDEHGYPSGAAGTLVLEENPEFEAQELAYDSSRADPFVVRPAYENTHASNNYHAARRYVNLLDDRATACFLRVTHDAYYERLKPFFGSTIQAAFTDEPSLIAVNIGQIPEEVRRRVPVVDPIDPNVKLLPRVPWCYDLAERYQERFGEELLPQRRSLFVGNGKEDRRVRRQYWSLVADLVADRYFGALGDWCEKRGVASSGHSLWEENILHHVPLEGNGIKVLSRMQIPGLDLLTSNPEAVVHSGWLTAGLPASAARLTGRRRIMTEVSDFSQKMGGQGPVGVAEMQATAAWQATWGVTDFTLYYGTGDRSLEDYRAYGDFVGRLNAILKPATPDPQVLLYYPIHDLWAEYLPVAEPLRMPSQSQRAQQLVASFNRLGRMLQRSQIPFTLTDHEHLAKAHVEDDGTMALAKNRYRAILLPDDAELPAQATTVLERFVQRGGRVIREGEAPTGAPGALKAALQPAERIVPDSPHVALGRFTREGRTVLAVVNVGQKPYAGQLQTSEGRSWIALDPATGDTVSPQAAPARSLPIELPPRGTRLFVEAR